MVENPPAFPCDSMTTKPTQTGMDLRDWFAGQALPRCIDAVAAGRAPLVNWIGTPAETAASIAYIMADAMLAARAIEPGKAA